MERNLREKTSGLIYIHIYIYSAQSRAKQISAAVVTERIRETGLRRSNTRFRGNVVNSSREHLALRFAGVYSVRLRPYTRRRLHKVGGEGNLTCNSLAAALVAAAAVAESRFPRGRFACEYTERLSIYTYIYIGTCVRSRCCSRKSRKALVHCLRPGSSLPGAQLHALYIIRYRRAYTGLYDAILDQLCIYRKTITIERNACIRLVWRLIRKLCTKKTLLMDTGLRGPSRLYSVLCARAKFCL